MANNFLAPRDSSEQNVPVVGYNATIEGQDVFLHGLVPTTETVVASAAGTVTVSKSIANIDGEFVREGTVIRGRDYSNSVTAMAGTTTLYAGELAVVNGVLATKEIKLYTNAAKTASVAAGTSVTITYYARIPVLITADGKLQVEGISEAPAIQDVRITNTPIATTPSITSLPTSSVNVLSVQPNPLPVSIAEGVSIGTVTVPRKAAVFAQIEANISSGARRTYFTPLNGADLTKDWFLTALYLSTDATALFPFYLQIYNEETGNQNGFPDMFLPVGNEDYRYYEFGEAGVRVFGASDSESLSFNTGSSWPGATVRAIAYGYRWDDGYTGD